MRGLQASRINLTIEASWRDNKPLRHAELRVAVLALPGQAQAAQFADGVVHGLKGAVAQARVRRMAAAAQDVDAFHHHAFVQANRLEPGRLADHRCATQRAPRFGQRTRAGHGAFFITGGKYQQRLLERLIQQRQHGFDGQGEKAFHVAAAQSYPAAVDLRQLERIGLPQCGVIGDCIAMTCQHQATGAAAETGQQVELAGADLLDIDGKAQVTQPSGEQVDHRAVGLVQRGLGATHRRRGDQGGELLFHGR